MSRYGVAVDDDIEIVTVKDRHDAPWCESEACYLHLGGHWDGDEHHAEGCPLYDTLYQAGHRLNHELLPAVIRLEAAITELPWPQRLPFRVAQVRIRVASQLRRLRWRFLRR